MIDYGRPARRGRRIFGAVVPWNQVWRAGANWATHLETSDDLTLGSLRLARGTYTLFVLPSPEGWALIINRQTSQWGTEYSRERDVARIPLEVRTTSAPVERLTYAIAKRNGRQYLELGWDTLIAAIPVGRQ